MLIWFILFFLVVAIAFVLAYQSMGDYTEHPFSSGKPYSLYLIQNPQALTEELFLKLYEQSLSLGAVLSLERLFKGQKKALVIFGPASLIGPLSNTLGIVELEDYSESNIPENILAWEVSFKKDHLKEQVLNQSLLAELPELRPTEQFWWQLVLKPQKNLAGSFQAALRAVFLTEDKKRVKELESTLFKIGSDSGLTMVPQVYSSSQMLSFYRQRTLPPKNYPGLEKIKVEMVLGFGEIKKLLGV